MSSELKFWNFVHRQLQVAGRLMLLVVAESTGSSPGRAGYKMAIAGDGELSGSIGGGVMEVKLVERAKAILSEPEAIASGSTPATLIEQVHQKNAAEPSGMICSGRQTVIAKQLNSIDTYTVNAIVKSLQKQQPRAFEISDLKFQIVDDTADESRLFFSKTNESNFVYQEKLGHANQLYIVGGGHCALALSELMSRMDFRISIFDDRPELNTISKNKFADEITIIDDYEKIGEVIPAGPHAYVVVMTLGYNSDEIVIRRLIDHELKYFGVLGSAAKMATLLKELRSEGVAADKLADIRTPIGLAINSHTPEEIAVSIAAEIIQIKNTK